MAENGEKSQDPTPHRRQQAREQGQVARSQDLGSAVLLVAALLALIMSGAGLVEFLGNELQHRLGDAPALAVDAGFAVFQWNTVFGALGQRLLPFLILLLVVGVLIDLAQVGFLMLPEKIMPDLERLNLLNGLGRIFSVANLMRLVFGILKLCVVATVAIVALYQERNTILQLAAMSVPAVSAYVAQLLLWTGLKIGVALMVLALLDYGYQWWKQEQDLKMTSQEVREEMKNLEGNPQVISRRKQVQRQLVMNRLSSTVPEADAVVTNPTELAVAIKYDPQSMAAPVVVAKGAGLLAQRIRQIALENGIPIIEKKPLAQALYRDVEVNHPIPQDKYAAVAEILAYVYQLKGKTLPAKAA